MRIPVNLASTPFRRDRPVLIASALVAVMLIGTLGFLISLGVSERRETNDTRVALARVNRQLAALTSQQAQLERRMRQPGNAVALDRSVLINTLIRRKAISWTRIFSDLESVLPPSVRILQVRPQVTSRDQVYLDLTIAAKSPEPVIGFLQKLEASEVFGSTAVGTVSPPTQTDAFYRYRLTVNYAQKL